MYANVKLCTTSTKDLAALEIFVVPRKTWSQFRHERLGLSCLRASRPSARPSARCLAFNNNFIDNGGQKAYLSHNTKQS